MGRVDDRPITWCSCDASLCTVLHRCIMQCKSCCQDLGVMAADEEDTREKGTRLGSRRWGGTVFLIPGNSFLFSSLLSPDLVCVRQT